MSIGKWIVVGLTIPKALATEIYPLIQPDPDSGVSPSYVSLYTHYYPYAPVTDSDHCNGVITNHL